MGNQLTTINKVNFEDIQTLNRKSYILINTLKKENQSCLIKGTLPIEQEINVINQNIKSSDMKIIIYGRNTNDDSIIIKYQQLYRLGLCNTYIYPGGLFEWLCLQDIYGSDQFPTTSRELDILKFKPISTLSHNHLIKDITG